MSFVSCNYADIEMFLWVLKSIVFILRLLFDFFYFYKQRKWIVYTDINPIKVYTCTYCLISTLPIIHSWASYIANTLKTHTLGCNEKYPLCLKV